MALWAAWRSCPRFQRLWVTVRITPYFVTESTMMLMVASEMTIIFDSGVRTGADVFKAIALGAHVVAIGRLFVWGMTHEGEYGCRHVLKSLPAARPSRPSSVASPDSPLCNAIGPRHLDDGRRIPEHY